MPAWLDTLAAFAADFRLDTLPPATIEQAGWVAIDSVGAILGGAAEPEMVALSARLAEDEPGDSPILGSARCAAPATAAFLNGAAGTFLEMDEGNRFARGHPAIHVLPAILAIAARRRLPGRAALEALVLGYEIGARVGIAANLRPSMHPHGTWGTVGAAAAIARLRGFDAARMAETLNVASSLTLASSKRTMLEGGTVRNAYAGVSNRLGLLAIDLVDAGFCGERDGLTSVFGSVVSERFDSARMIEGLGTGWQIDRNYFKLHSCCRYNHGALDALELVLARDSVAPEQVARVEVESYLYAAELDDPEPRNTLGAKFSVPFAIATRLVRGSTEVENFTWDAVRDRRVLALAQRVSVREDKAMTARLPAVRPARVALTLTDGRTLEAAVEANRGDDQDPYSRDELATKYASLAARVWPADRASRVRDRLLLLSAQPNVATLFD